MAYNNFTTEKMFEDESVNVLCNLIYETLIKKFGNATITTDLFITGTVAKIIQGEPVATIKVIPLITDNPAIFEYAKKTLPKKVNALGTIVLTDRSQLIFKKVYIEIWNTNLIGAINTINNFEVQAISDIPPYIN